MTDSEAIKLTKFILKTFPGSTVEVKTDDPGFIQKLKDNNISGIWKRRRPNETNN